MSPRRSVQDALLTKERIVDAGVALASSDGLGGVSIGSLADALAMSKAGVIGPFGSKSDLQGAVLARASAMFTEAVIMPAMAEPAGLPRLRKVINRWTSYLADCPFPNGCFITAVSCELDAHEGPLREQLVETVTRWRSFLRDQVVAGRKAGDIPKEVDPDDAVHTLVGLSMAANQEIQLLGDQGAARRARRLMLAAVRAGASG
ncbi:TetR/AcrR family transcriptional regulator [Herbihabitans rhizosphaerae]|nr:TetR/AcrR family transcriptional regulator [Herbihabitans rhizosphaerae]